MIRLRVHNYREFEHPLAQIEAAREFYEFVDAHVQDEWSDVYVDPPPSAEQVSLVEPASMLKMLRKLQLRFELAGYVKEEGDESYWVLPSQKQAIDGVLWGNMFSVLDEVGLDSRAFEHGLWPTDLIFIRDDKNVVAEALKLLRRGEQDLPDVEERSYDQDERRKMSYREDFSMRSHSGPRGGGIREGEPAMVDRAAAALRAAAKPLTPEEIAGLLGHRNVASIGTALHQVVAYRKPKRLAGWIARDQMGKYVWLG